MTTLNWGAVTERAVSMSPAALRYAIRDCIEAGKAAWALEKAGRKVLKSQGYYHDEASVYRAELKRRGIEPEASA